MTKQRAGGRRAFVFLSAVGIFLGLAVGVPTTAWADDVDIELRAQVLKGQDEPALIITANKEVASVKADLAGGGRSFPLRHGRLRRGKTAEMIIAAPVGVTELSGQLTVTFSDGGTASMPLTFSVEVVAGFEIEVPADRLRLPKGELDLKLTRAAGKCQYEVILDGKSPREGTVDFTGRPAGTWLTVSWPSDGEHDLVLRITLRCFDADGVFETGRELYPWKVAIPHEDVIFESAKWDVMGTEMPKLEAAYGEVDKAVRRYGKWIKGVKLFVGGHTDTVGDKAYNRELSWKRARSIARAFRKLGVRVPILFTGFGEEALAVPTPDQTAEAANRRAEYIIAVEPPTGGSWQSL